MRLGISWKDHWKPDVIYSSGPPHSAHVVAARLASRFHIPWIAELRDLWINDPYFDRHWFIKPFHDLYAKNVLSQAMAFVVVTSKAREHLLEDTDKRVLVSYNGYDPRDFDGLDDVGPLDQNHLTIVHAGTIYPGRRDPTPLFKAIAALGEARKRVRCIFYSDANGSVACLARQIGIEECVEIRDPVARSQILRIERQGKLFEYIGARRPILSLGSLTAEAAAIVRDNGLGLVSIDSDEIKGMLMDCLKVKATLGRLPDRIRDPNDKFHRETQFDKIDRLIEDLLLLPPKRAQPNGS
jgi:hypothetical protein